MPVGGFLEVLPTGPQTLLGSGHPDRKGVLPEFLGVLRSEDGGRTWTVIARLGEADLHRMVLKQGKLYAFDAVLGAVLVSTACRARRPSREPARLKALDAEHLVRRAQDRSDPGIDADGAKNWKPVYRP